MKTATEWAKDFWSRPQSKKFFIPFIREVQKDALETAMSIMLDECCENNDELHQVKQDIIRIRDDIKPST